MILNSLARRIYVWPDSRKQIVRFLDPVPGEQNYQPSIGAEVEPQYVLEDFTGQGHTAPQQHDASSFV